MKTYSSPNLYKNVYSSSIHKCPKLETTQMSSSRWMDKLYYVHAMEYYSVKKRNKLIHNNLNGSQRHYAERNMLVSKDRHCETFMSPFIWHSGKGKTTATENRSVIVRVRASGTVWWHRSSTREFWGHGSVLYLDCSYPLGKFLLSLLSLQHFIHTSIIMLASWYYNLTVSYLRHHLTPLWKTTTAGITLMHLQLV